MNRLLFGILSIIAMQTAMAQGCNDETAYGRPSRLEPEQWGPVLACHKKKANAGESSSQAWLGQAYLGGYGTVQSHVLAAQWFAKAAKQGNTDAAFELAEMIYYRQVPQKGSRPIRELYYQAAEPFLGLTAEKPDAVVEYMKAATLKYAGRPPHQRMVSILMVPGVSDADKALASRFALFDQKAMVEGRKIARKYPVAKVLEEFGVTAEMPAGTAISLLSCTSDLGTKPNYFAVAAAIESYGVVLEDAFSRPCPATKLLSSTMPLNRAFRNRSSSGDIGLASIVRALSMYMIWTRGDHKGLSKILQSRVPGELTVGEEVAAAAVKEAWILADAESAFRKHYNSIDPKIRSGYKFSYHLKDWITDFPLYLVDPKTSDFKHCAVMQDSYDNIDQLEEKVTSLASQGAAGALVAGSVKGCLAEPDYQAKLQVLYPYYKVWGGLLHNKDVGRNRNYLSEYGGTLLSICDFATVHSSTPSYCLLNTKYLIGRLRYWSDNNLSGYRYTSR